MPTTFFALALVVFGVGYIANASLWWIFGVITILFIAGVISWKWLRRRGDIPQPTRYQCRGWWFLLRLPTFYVSGYFLRHPVTPTGTEPVDRAITLAIALSIFGMPEAACCLRNRRRDHAAHRLRHGVG